MCVLCFATTRPMRSVNPWLKWSTFFFSACCLVAGILVMATSLILSFKPAYSYVFFNDNQYYGVILAAGAVLTLAGILGCVGALSRSSCLLYTFSLCAALFIAGEVVVGFLLYKNSPTFLEKLQGDIKQSVEFDYGGNATITRRIDFIQEGWNCCGVNTHSSWSKSKYGGPANKDVTDQSGTYFVPESCCIDQKSQECQDIQRRGIRGSNDAAHLHKQGCVTVLVGIVDDHSHYVYVVLTLIVALQAIAMILSTIMAFKLGMMIRRERYIQRESYETHQASAPMLSSATSMDSHKMFPVSTPSSVHVSKSSLHLDPSTLDIPKSSLV